MSNSKPTILALSNDQKTRQFFNQHLKPLDVNLIVRQSRDRCLHILSISEVALIVLDQQLEDCSGLELIKEIKQSDLFYSDVPIYAFGSEENKETDCINIFNAGADDYSTALPHEPIFVARVRKLLNWSEKQKNNPVKLATKMDAKEVPGILQLLETEKSTGTLIASYHKEHAQATLQNGMIIDAHTEYCTGKDAITEILAWPFAQIKFTEDPHAPDNIEKPKKLNISSALMDCVLDVDIYKDACKRLNNTEMAFTQGSKSLPAKSNRVAKQVVTMAHTGLSLGEIFETVRVNKRHLTLMIEQMIKADYIRIAAKPFDNYLTDNSNNLKFPNADALKSIHSCRKQLATLDIPLTQELSKTPFASSSMILNADCTNLIIAGDDPKQLENVFKTLVQVAANTSHVHAKVSSQRKGEKRTKLIFRDQHSIDLISCTNKLDFHYLKSIHQDYKANMGVIYCISALDNPSNQLNQRNLRKLRNEFQVPFTVALIADDPLNGYEPSFTFECSNCTHKLQIEMSLEDSLGTCPICTEQLKTPDCLDYAKEKLQLQDYIPIVTLPSSDDDQWRDLLTMLLDDVLTNANYSEHIHV